MELTLHPDEASALYRVLSRSVSDLRREIDRTNDQHLRVAMQAEDRMMRNLIARLAGGHGAIDRWADEASTSSEQTA